MRFLSRWQKKPLLVDKVMIITRSPKKIWKIKWKKRRKRNP